MAAKMRGMRGGGQGMPEGRGYLPMVIAAVVAVLLQLLLAPNIKVFNAMPNFVAAFALSYAIAQPRRTASLVLAFIMGLAFNLICGGVVGAMSLLLSIAAFVLMRFFERIDNDTLAMPFIALAICALVINVLYAVISLLAGSLGGFGDALIYRALPCTLYDIVASFIAYPLVKRFVARDAQGAAAPIL